MSAIQEGKQAPDFTLPDAEGKPVKLSEFRTKKSVVLYFYPKDDTPGCTKEACSFRDGFAKFRALGAEVIGVSADDAQSHQKFAKKYSLPFTLLSDADKKVVELYGVWKEKSMYGKTYMGIERTTFVIDKQGIVRKIFPKVKVDGHDGEVLELLKTLA